METGLPELPGLWLTLERLPGESATPGAAQSAALCAAFPDAASRRYIQELGQGRMAAVRLAALALLPPLLTAAGYHPAGLSLAREANGRPFLRPVDPDLCAPDISLSHSGAHILCALRSGGRVGVDVEEPVPAARAARLAARFFSAGERRLLAEAREPEELSEAFTRIWTRKEALCKQDGGGQPLRFDSEKPPSGVRLLSVRLPDTGAALSVCW